MKKIGTLLAFVIFMMAISIPVSAAGEFKWTKSGDFKLTVGKVYTLTAGGGNNATYFSSDNTVVKVESTGKVTPLKPGTVRYYARSGDTTIQKTLWVIKEGGTIPELSWTVSSDLKLETGKSRSIAAVSLSGAAITYKSSNVKVATVDKNGTIQGIASGTATITATSGKNIITKDITVTASSTSSNAKPGTSTAPSVPNQGTTPPPSSGGRVTSGNTGGETFDFGNGGNDRGNAAALTSSDISWIVSQSEEYVENTLGLTWSTERSQIGDYYLGGHSMTWQTFGKTRTDVLSEIKSQIDEDTKINCTRFYVELKERETGNYDVYVYRG